MPGKTERKRKKQLARLVEERQEKLEWMKRSIDEMKKNNEGEGDAYHAELYHFQEIWGYDKRIAELGA